METILVGEDDFEVRCYLTRLLKGWRYSVETAENGEEVIHYLKNGHPVSGVLLDIVMPRKDGLDTLREIRSRDLVLPVIMVSALSSARSVVDAMRLGATDFLTKPINDLALREALESAVRAGVGRGGPHLNKSTDNTYTSISNRMKDLQLSIPPIARSEVSVLIQAETGSGKEVLARQIHALSSRSQRVFLKLNCAALPSELVESELFGYERGAFTGAFQRKPGMFELADGGTLMLDEIGDMDFKLQAKLLQVLQDCEFHRLGGKETVRVNVRVIAATHQDLELNIAEGRFRPDLFYRLNVIDLRLPPLRECPEDIIPLAGFLLRRHAGSNLSVPVISPALKEALMAYSWPGNVRELENVMRNLTVLRNPDLLARELRGRAVHRTFAVEAKRMLNGGSDAEAPVLVKATLAKEQAETGAILNALNATHWNRKQASILLKIDYKALLYKMKKLSIDATSVRTSSDPLS